MKKTVLILVIVFGTNILFGQSDKKYEFSSCQDLKCLNSAFAVTSLQCDMEAKCNGKEWAENLNNYIHAAERLNLPFSSWQNDLKNQFDSVILFNAWGIYYFLESEADDTYKNFLLNSLEQKRKDVLAQIKLYLNNGDLKNSIPKENVGFYSYDTFNNGLEIYRLELREAELLKQFEAQSNIKQGEIQSKIDIKKVLSKLIAPENIAVYWQKTTEGFEVIRTFGNIRADVVNTKSLGNHLIGQDLVLGKKYVLRDFKNAQLNVKYEALEYNKDINFWVKNENSVSVLINGEVNDLVSRQSFESPVDAVVNYKGEYHILGNFKNAKEGTIQTTSNISIADYEISKGEKAPKTGVYWKSYGKFYYLVKDGEYIDFEVEHKFIGNDVLVYHPRSNSSYLFKDYQSQKDGKWREPIILKSNQAAWIKFADGTFNCYEKATKSITKNEWSKENSNDLWIMDYKGKPKYVLKNFKSAKTNAFFVAQNLEDKTTNTSPESNTTSTVNNSKQPIEKSDNLKELIDLTCIEGNCTDGYGKVQLSNNETMEGFFENGMAFGPLLLKSPDTNLESFSTFKGDYNNPIGFEYNYTKGKSTLLIDRDLGFAMTYLPENKEFFVMIVSGGEIEKSIKLESNSKNPCQVGNCQDGAGFYVYSNGATYMGFFKNGKYHGPGQLNYNDTEYYVGNFNLGKKSGLGTYVWDHDTNYFGEWKNDKYDGKGVYQYSESSKKAGLWQNGEYVNSLDGIQYQPETENTINNLEIDSKIFDSVKSYVESVNGDNGYLAKIIDNDYRNLQKTLSGDELYKETSKYFVALYKIDPKLVFSVFMKWNDSESLVPIKDQLPKEINDNLKLQAQELMNGYNKYINSKETQDKIKEHGGGFKKVNNK